MRLYPLFLLTALALPTAVAGTTYFELEPGQSGDFVVTGEGPPTLTVYDGNVQSGAPTQIGDVWIIRLECVSSTPCSGRVDA